MTLSRTLFLRTIYTLCLLALLLPAHVAAQLLPGTAESTEKPVEEEPDSLGRRTPRGTLTGFIQAVADEDYAKASQFLNLKRSQRKVRERERIVKTLQGLMDQSGNLIPTALMSNKNTGRTDDDLPSGTDLVGTVTVDEDVINLTVENTAGSDSPAVWRFSTETVDAVAAVKLKENLLVDKVLPTFLKEKRLAGVPLGHWLAMVILIAFSYLAAWAILSLFFWILNKTWRLAGKAGAPAFIEALNLPFRLYLAVWLFVDISQRVGISIIVRQKFSAITVTIGIIAFLILLWRIADYASNYGKNKMSLQNKASAISVILFLRRTAKVAIVVMGIVAFLGVIGVDVNAGIAALGIGGIALALGAQKTVENFVGSVTLVTDQPVRVGDFCKVDTVKGTVESIGMRSTQIRTDQRTIITIPNGLFSSGIIENYSHRDRYLFNPVLEFRRETTPDQIRFLLVELRTILYSHPAVNPDPAKVRLTGYTKDSLKMEVFAYIQAANYDAFQEVQEDLLLHFMDVVKQSGTTLAAPAQTIIIAPKDNVSDEKAQLAAEKVKEWRNKKELQIPAFDPEEIERLKDSITYPPEGSVMERDTDKLPPLQ